MDRSSVPRRQRRGGVACALIHVPQLNVTGCAHTAAFTLQANRTPTSIDAWSRHRQWGTTQGRRNIRKEKKMRVLGLIAVLFLIVGALPIWSYSSDWGY